MNRATRLAARLAPQTGAAFLMERGMQLRVTAPEGEQVADLTAFALEGRREWLSSGRTIDYNDTIRLTAGHVLYSNRSREMLTIVEDSVGRHDFLYAPCSPEMFERTYGFDKSHPSCFQNLADSLAAFDIGPDLIPTTFNIFMNVEVGSDGALEVKPPLVAPDDSIVLRAEIDLVVGLTACSAELSNNWRFKPIEYSLSR
jgi:uncharacterized protein YcgI (DUF1989 family)